MTMRTFINAVAVFSIWLNSAIYATGNFVVDQQVGYIDGSDYSSDPDITPGLPHPILTIDQRCVDPDSGQYIVCYTEYLLRIWQGEDTCSVAIHVRRECIDLNTGQILWIVTPGEKYVYPADHPACDLQTDHWYDELPEPLELGDPLPEYPACDCFSPGIDPFTCEPYTVTPKPAPPVANEFESQERLIIDLF